MSDQLDDLIAAIGRAPVLPGARCRGRHHLFDTADSREDPDVAIQRHSQAVELCARCPSLTRCEDWLDSLPNNQRPLGVVAGRVNLANPVGRPKAEQQ